MFEEKVSVLNQSTKETTLHYEKRTYSVSEIQDILEIGRNAAYDLVKKGCFSTVKIGGIIRMVLDRFMGEIEDKSKDESEEESEEEFEEKDENSESASEEDEDAEEEE